MKSETKSKIKTFIIALIIPLAIGGLSAFLTRNNMDIYKEINSPPFSPPSIVFSIVWPILYVLMGISSALIWINRQKDIENATKGLVYYAVSLVFNFEWSLIFFNFKRYLLAFIWLLAMLYFIIRMVIAYKKVCPVAAYLQIPYVVWVTFAGYLTFGIWWLNR